MLALNTDPILPSNLLTAKVKRLTSWVQLSIYHRLTWGILIRIACLLPTPTPVWARCSHLSTSRWLATILHRDSPLAKTCLQDWVSSRVGRLHQWFVTTTVMTTGVHPTTLPWSTRKTTPRRKRRIRRKSRDYHDRYYHYPSIYLMKNQRRSAFLRKRMSRLA